MTIDERISSELRRHAPEVDENAAWRLIESAATAKRRPRLPYSTAAVFAAALVAIVLGFGFIPTLFSGPTPASGGFLGTWVTTDGDGSIPTMTIQILGDDAVEIEVHDDFASVCSGAPSTMIGTGRLEGTGELVVPSPVLTCDDGSQPEALSGPPLEQQLRNLTFIYDPTTESLTDNFGMVWRPVGEGDPDPEPTIRGSMWPQASIEEVRAAQELADAGDPDYTWQLNAGLAADDQQDRMYQSQVELVDRFIREVLGWEAYQWNMWEGGDFSSGSLDGLGDGALTDQRFIRCAPGAVNPLYPASSDPMGAGSCAPTLDDLSYESVGLDLIQPDRRGPDGIWVVNGWRTTAPFAQTDPAVAEAEATDLLEAFLAARIAGQGAEGSVDVRCWFVPACGELPLLYTTTSGAPYERYEIDLVDGPEWPFAWMTFSVRLFADDGATLVEQTIDWTPDDRLAMNYGGTTENGRPVNLPYYFLDGEVVASAPGEWWENYSTDEDARFIDVTDPFAPDEYGSQGCEPGAQSGDAAAVAQAVIADPNFVTTAPVAVSVGGVEALSIDVTLAPGAEVSCWRRTVPIGVWIYALAPGLRQRLYLVDVPEGMSTRTLAITVTAHESRFEETIDEARAIIDSIEFHTG